MAARMTADFDAAFAERSQPAGAEEFQPGRADWLVPFIAAQARHGKGQGGNSARPEFLARDIEQVGVTIVER